MAILTASEDQLKFDPLKGGDMDSYDPLDSQESKRIAIYDKELGMALHPEQKQAVLDYKKRVGQSADEQQGALDKYKSGFSDSMSEADKQAQGILGQYKTAPAQKKIPINVMAEDGSIEGTYYVNKSWADKSMSKIDGKQAGDEYNVNVNFRGQIQGKEIHKLLTDAQEQTLLQDKEIAGINEAVSVAKGGAEAEIASHRGIATGAYNQNVDQAEQIIQATKDMWTNFMAEQQASFKRGIQTNTGGIRDLLESGALVIKGSVS